MDGNPVAAGRHRAATGSHTDVAQTPPGKPLEAEIVVPVDLLVPLDPLVGAGQSDLALSRKGGPGMEAIVFDYDLLGIGTRYSDYRNVTGSLSGEAATGFREFYGSVDPDERTLDRPLATLYALVSAARMATFPKWAEACRQTVLNGTFKTDLLQAVDLAGDGRKAERLRYDDRHQYVICT